MSRQLLRELSLIFTVAVLGAFVARHEGWLLLQDAKIEASADCLEKIQHGRDGLNSLIFRNHLLQAQQNDLRNRFETLDR